MNIFASDASDIMYVHFALWLLFPPQIQKALTQFNYSKQFLNKNKQILSLAPFSRTSLLIRESFSSLTGVFQKIFGEKPSPCHSFCYTVVAIVDISGRISVLIFLLLSM